MEDLHIDHYSPTPLYIQAEQLLRRMINEKRYANGKLLPSEVELAAKLHISRNTLRQAINKLVFEGLLLRKKGYGTKVIKRGVSSGAKNWLSFSQEMAAAGIVIRNFELHISYKTADDEICDFFGIESGAKLFSLERLRGKIELPFVYFESYFSPAIPISADENFARPLYEILQVDYGVVVKSSKEEISAQIASDFIAEKLGITTADPVLVRKRFVYDQNDIAIEYNIGYYRADSFVYTIESAR